MARTSPKVPPDIAVNTAKSQGINMKVDNSIKSVPGVGAVAESHGRIGKSGKPVGKADGDGVEPSPLSPQLQAIEASLANTEVVDAARVSEIKQAISEGRFKVNPEAVAQRLLETVQDLLKTQKKP